MWLLVVLFTIIMCLTFIVKKECFENPKIDLLDNTSTSQKYTSHDALSILHMVLNTLGNDYVCVYVSKVKRQGPYIKMRAFIQNIKTLVVLEYEMVGKIPMIRKGCYELTSYNIVNANENDLNGSSINNGMYHKLKK